MLGREKHSSVHKVSKRQSSGADIKTSPECLAGGLYVSPAKDAVVNSLEPVQISWNPNCLQDSTQNIDIYLYAPSQQDASLPIHKYSNIPKNVKNWQVKGDQFKPSWWLTDPYKNYNVSLSLNIVPSGNQPWDTANPMGPSWTATYAVPTAGRIPPVAFKEHSKFESVVSTFIQGGTLTAAGKTAAIVVPTVIVACILAVFIRKLHINRQNKSAVWADHMDRRMSRISVDWTTGGDGSTGPVPGTRPASFISRASQDGSGLAGQGAIPRVPRQMVDITPALTSEDEMREALPRGFSLYEEGNRTSRISFAGTTRGDRVSRISYATSNDQGHVRHQSIPRIGQNGRRSQVQTDSYYDPDAPAVPHLVQRFQSGNQARCSSRLSDGLVYTQDVVDEDDVVDDDDDEILMSPTQHDGPTPLGNQDVDKLRESLNVGRSLTAAVSDASLTHVAETDPDIRNSMLKYPDLTRIQSGREESDANGMLDDHSPASSHSYINHDHYHNATTTAASSSPPTKTLPDISIQTGMAPPVNVASPDEALKRYASMRAPSGPGTAGSNTMRSLYTPESASGHRAKSSATASSFNEDEVVGYNEMIDHGNLR